MMGLEHASVRVYVYVRGSTLSNYNISERRGDLKHHLEGGKAALGFGPDRIKILVPMATDSSHRVIMGEILLEL